MRPHFEKLFEYLGNTSGMHIKTPEERLFDVAIWTSAKQVNAAALIVQAFGAFIDLERLGTKLNLNSVFPAGDHGTCRN